MAMAMRSEVYHSWEINGNTYVLTLAEALKAIKEMEEGQCQNASSILTENAKTFQILKMEDAPKFLKDAYIFRKKKNIPQRKLSMTGA